MNRSVFRIVLSLGLAVFVQGFAISQTRDRADIPTELQWNLEAIYPSDEAWKAAKDKIAEDFEDVLAFKGKLAESPRQLLACLNLNGRINQELSRLFSYASMKSDQDTRNSTYLGMKQMMQKLATDYGARSSFISPEVGSMDQATIEAFIDQQPDLEPYAFQLRDIQRTKAHQLPAAQERILAETQMLAAAPSTIYSVFSYAECPFPELTLADGQTVTLNQAGYARYRAVPDRTDRKSVFDAFFGTYDGLKQTFGTTLSSQVDAEAFYARLRDYDSTLHRALDADKIPVQVYHALVDNVNNNLDSFHRYLRLKQRMLGVDQLAYYDVYAPVVEQVDLEYSYEEASELALTAVAPLGPGYVRDMKQAFDDRWIDVYPNPGKRAGAYCNGSCYDVHPYVLLNYNGRYDDVSTLAHELGHAMHSYYSNKTQPYATADYATFVAEVASTLDEALLIDYVLGTIEDDQVKLSLLMNQLDGIKGTVFRQTQFAEFELAIHQKAEQGEPLTGDVLTEIYGDIIKRYYGHDQGICQIDDGYCVEWAYVPHFYYNFYVYQYSTSFTASTCLSERILQKEPGAVEDVMQFLSAGGSGYPVDILKHAGVDMMTSEPFDRTMAVMNRVMDQIEEILDRQERTQSSSRKRENKRR